MAVSQVIDLVVGGRKTRVYLIKETAKFGVEQREEIEKHARAIFEYNKETLDHGKKNVLIMWGENNKKMTDWWIWGEDESPEEGATIEVYLFRETESYESPFVTAEDGLLVLAEEVDCD